MSAPTSIIDDDDDTFLQWVSKNNDNLEVLERFQINIQCERTKMKKELNELQKQQKECKEANGKLNEHIDVLQRKYRRAESRDEFVDSVAREALKRKDERLLSAGKFMCEAKKRSSMFILPDDDNDELESIPRAADMTDPQIVVSSPEKGIDYDELIRSPRISPELIMRMESIIQKPVHHLIRRGIFASHRDLELIVNAYEQKKRFFLYTGCGPLSEEMHLGHLVPLIMTKWLQDAFDVPLVIHMTNDKEFLLESGTIDDTNTYAWEHAKDIIACGFDPNKTFIFSDFDTKTQRSYFLGNFCRMQKSITFNQVEGTFGFVENDWTGTIASPVSQETSGSNATLSSVFNRQVQQEVRCLVPCFQNQDRYLGTIRGMAQGLHFPQPALIHSTSLPTLQYLASEMTGFEPDSYIFLADIPNAIQDKINRHALNRDRETTEDHRATSGDCETDAVYEYLRFFLADDERIEKIDQDYSTGNMLTSELKKELIELLQGLLTHHQKRREAVTIDYLRTFVTPRQLSFRH